jgi:hypothetical protein
MVPVPVEPEAREGGGMGGIDDGGGTGTGTGTVTGVNAIELIIELIAFKNTIVAQVGGGKAIITTTRH